MTTAHTIFPLLLQLSAPEPAAGEPSAVTEAAPDAPGEAAGDEPTEPSTPEPEPEPDPEPAPEPEPEPELVAAEGTSTATVTAPAPVVESSTTTDAPVPPPEPQAKEDDDGPTFNIGVQGFFRGEGRFNPGWEAEPIGRGRHNGQVLQRIRLQAEGKWKWMTVFAQVQDSRVWGFEPSTTANTANTDLHQGYMQLGGANEEKGISGYVRVGRQRIVWGSQRLIGHLGWLAGGRSFDALSGELRYKKYGVRGFAAIMDRQQNYTLDDGTNVRNSGSQLYGGQVFGNTHPFFNFEVLFLGYEERSTESAPTRPRRQVYNPGARLFGGGKGFKYDVEANVQFGEVGGRTHRAWAFAAWAGYTFEKVKVKPGLRVGYNIASGEACSNPNDGMSGCGGEDSTEFFNFFPTNHIHYGYIDLMGWRNMRELDVRASLKPHKMVGISVDYHFFQLHEANGAWKNAGGALIGAGWDPQNTDNNLGSEIDVTLKISPLKQLWFEPGYSVFMPHGGGQALLAGDDPQHFAWLWFIGTIGAKNGP